MWTVYTYGDNLPQEGYLSMLQRHQQPVWSGGQKSHCFWVQENISRVHSCLPVLALGHGPEQLCSVEVNSQESDFWSQAHPSLLGDLQQITSPLWVPVSSRTKGKVRLDQVFKLCSLQLQASRESTENRDSHFHSLHSDTNVYILRSFTGFH